jgi:hypothetical protein
MKKLIEKILYVIKYANIYDLLPIYTLMITLKIYEWVIVFLRLYKLLIQTKLLFDLLPLFNPYYWPLSIVYDLTRFYIQALEDLIPRIRIFGITVDLTMTIGIELLSILIEVFMYGAEFTVNKLNFQVDSLIRKQRLNFMFKAFISSGFKMSIL